MEQLTIGKDFGTVYLDQNIKQGDFNHRDALKSFMESHGYDTNNCDICSVRTEWFDEEVEVMFKFVHYSVKTMDSVDYYCVRFKEA
jgi:hypothetical protein